MKDSQNIFHESLHVAAWLVGLLLSVSVKAQNNIMTDWRYTVRPKDTLFALAQQHLKPSIGWEQLARYNHLSDAHVINAGMQLRMPLSWLAGHQAKVKLVALSGEVLIQSIGGQWHKAQLAELLQTGQVIQVNSNSSASLQFADMSELTIQPNSTVHLNTLSVYAGGYMTDTKLRLQAGRIEIHTNPSGLKGRKFEVITPAAVASVRGTQFLVDVKADRTLEQTISGSVLLNTDQGSVLVQDGYGSTVKLGERPLQPELIKPAPELKNASSKFSEFPIAFTLVEQLDALGWVMQVGRDTHMTQLVLEQQASHADWDAGVLADGIYHLRAWSLDAQGMPSKPLIHSFEVAIPRILQGPAIQLPKAYFANGPMVLNLAPLSKGQKYLVQVTKDPDGRLPIWHMSNVGTSVSIPAPLDQVQPCYLWVWIY